MSRSPPAWLRALGKLELPASFVVAGRAYRHLRTFKHDFFAATGVYERVGFAGKAVLKVGRLAPLWGLPMRWAGRLVTGHEVRLYRMMQSIEGVPCFIGRWGPTGFVHEYIEGRPLAKADAVGDEFFPQLSKLLDAIHARGAAYVDLEKPENILLGEDGRPYLIDFQISFHWPANRGGGTSFARYVLGVLQRADRYHLLKHWRRFRPDQFAQLGLEDAFVVPPWVRLHRAVFRPVTVLRRQILVWLGARSSRSGRSPG